VPILTAQTWVWSILNGMPIPGNNTPLEVFVTPPNPEEDQLDPHVYVWPSTGSESRQSLPRAPVPNLGTTQSGWKTMPHQLDIWVVWFQDDSDPTPDASFPVIVDAIMDVLRTCQDPVMLTDPVTGRYSQIYGTGERLTYDIATPRGVNADQRILRYDARIAARVLEDFQA
jgi:hypothetical protein